MIKYLVTNVPEVNTINVLHDAMSLLEKAFLTHDGPRDVVSYPLNVLYCGECSMPIEFCEYCANNDRCKEWLQRFHPEDFAKLTIVDKGDTQDGDKKDDVGGEDKKRRQTRGGKGLLKTKKKVEPQGIQVWTASRAKKKKVTIIGGLASYGFDLKDCSKFFASKFSCGTSVNDDLDIVVQGDVKDVLFSIIPGKWPQIEEDDIEDMGDKK